MINITPLKIESQRLGPSVSLTLIKIGPSSDGQATGEPSDLVVPWHDLQENPSIFSLLSWHTRVSNFEGRDEELTELHRWVTSRQKISIKFVTGMGGVGKSRLAAEFATRLQGQNWAAGFVDLRKPQAFKGHLEGTLLIVDYPEEDQSGVRELFQDLARLQDVGRLRLLFLTRQKVSSWKDVVQDTRAESLVDMMPVNLSGLDHSAAHEIYLSVSDKSGEIFDSVWKPINQAMMADWLKEAPENDLALFIMAAAVHNTLKPEVESIKYKGREIVESLVERELARIRNVALNCNIFDNYLFPGLLAIATIADVIPANKIDGVLEQIASPKKLPENFDAECELQNAGLLLNREIQALKPDIVAAAFVVQVFSQKPQIAPELIWTALNEDISGGIQRLARLSYDAEVVLGKHKYRLSQWLAEAVKDSIDRAIAIDEAVASMDQLPLGLLEVAIATWRTLLSETEDIEEKARILNNLSVDLSYSGDKNGALVAILEAVEIRERLAVSNPEAFEPDLAMSLNNLGTHYADLGKRAEALEAAKRAVEIRERLAASNPEAFEPALAMSLNNLGNRYSELGKRAEASGAVKRAVEIYERLAVSNPEAFEPDLAASLNSLGNCYSEFGKRAEALEAVKRAVEIYERLAVSNPEAFEPALAMSLNNLGNCYSELGKRAEALEAVKRAVEIRERLAASNPEAFEPDLAMSLNNLGNRYSELGKRAEALEAVKRAVEIRERLAVSNPEAFEPDLAMSLNNLGTHYADLGKHANALEAAKRAVEIRERLAVSNPEAFEPDLAMSLNNLGTHYADLGKHANALEAAKRAVEIRERLATSNPEAFEPDLAMSLSNIGAHYAGLGKRAEALEAAKRAVEIRERLAASNPEAFEPDLAMSLNNLGTHYADLGKRAEALEAAKRAVEIRERLAASNPEAFEPALAMSLNNLGNRYSELGKRAEASGAVKRAVEIRERLAASNPEASK